MFSKIFKVFLINIFLVLFITSLTLAQEDNKKYLVYKNDTMGVEITYPTSWFKYENSDAVQAEEPGRVSRLLYITSSPKSFGGISGDDGAIILDTVSVTDAQGKVSHGKTPLEYAKYIVDDLKRMRIEEDGGSIIEEPTLVKINNLEGARYKYELYHEHGHLILYKYIFNKGNLFYLLGYQNESAYFDKHLKEFETVLNSLVLK